MKTKQLEKIVTFTPAFDKRNSDPKKNYGIGSVRCNMVLKGKKGAVHFVFSTGIYLPETIREYKQDGRDLFHFSDGRPSYYMGFDVGYHSPTKRFKEQGISQKECEWLDGKPCYCDGSGLRAEKFMDILIRKGSDAIWKELEKDYKELFN